MSSTNSALMNRLILLVLCLNLVCVTLLVFRSYQNPGRPSAQGAPAERAVDEAAVEPALERAPAPPVVVKRPAAGTVTRTSVPAPVRNAAPAVDPIPAPSDAPGVAPAPDLASAGLLVNLPSRSGVGVPRVSAGGAGALPELSGRVLLRGMPPPEIPIEMSPQCSSLNPDARLVTTRHFVVNSEGGLANVLVWLKNAAAAPPVVETPLLDQVGCMFEPYVMGVVAGQQFQVRNSDGMLHNLHATPRRNREFNFAQPAKGQLTTLSFSQPELAVRIKCDVHPWMFAYVHVLEHPYFAITDSNGVFRLPSGFPAGRYVVGVSHLKAGESEQQIQLHQGERRELNFELNVPPRAQARR